MSISNTFIYISINFDAQIAQNLTKFDFEITDFQALEAYRRVWDGFSAIFDKLGHLKNTEDSKSHNKSP